MYFATAAIVACLLYSYGSFSVPVLIRALKRVRVWALKCAVITLLHCATAAARLIVSYRKCVSQQKTKWLLGHVAYPARRHANHYWRLALPCLDAFYKLDKVAFRLKYSELPWEKVHVCSSTEYTLQNENAATELRQYLRTAPGPPAAPRLDCTVPAALLQECSMAHNGLQRCWQANKTQHCIALQQQQQPTLIDVHYRQYDCAAAQVAQFRHLYVLPQELQKFPPAPPMVHSSSSSSSSAVRCPVIWEATAGETDLTQEVREYAGPLRDFCAASSQPMTAAHLKLALALRHAHLRTEPLVLDMN